ncbi:MAG: DUF2207 domain-containing protein [Candidatus Avelusimicrobium sp.]|uniref:DUF2207 domain-containing protein n=1 Tax=Candidatus Avelusimicrobium sp. TaxID=3048833 RepID=UPI003F0D60B2
MKRFLICLILCVCTAVFAGAWATEEIEQLSSSAVVKEDASVLVTETIAVRANGDKIRRGIFRTLPYKGVSDYEIVSVSRDGKEEPYTVKKSSSEKTVYIGDAGRILPPGRYVYELSYTVKGAVRFQKDFDEFYWNVTGNDWQFPIQSASFRLSLPQGAAVVPGGVSLYTGAAGEKGRHARQVRELFFETTRPLLAYEGFTVSVAWNKGVIKELSFFDKHRWEILWGILAWGLVAAYYIYIGRRVGKEPKSRVLRRFEPPEGLSPAQVHYFCCRTWSNSTLSVVFMSLVQKGFVRVVKTKNGHFQLERTAAETSGFLSPEECACLNALFEKRQKVPVINSESAVFQAASSAVGSALKKWSGERFFVRGVRLRHLPSFFVLLVLFWILANSPVVFFVAIVFGMFACALLNCIFKSSLSALIGFGGVMLWLLGALKTVLILGTLVPGEWLGRRLAVHTPLGRQKMDEIEGFKEYLEVAETNRVFASNPTDSARIYCNYLPYAVALGVQNKWWNAFESALGEAAAKQVLELQGYSVMAAGELSALASAISLASVPPSSNSSSSNSSFSRSGFGGGGCSGGGSGGGGGGGW